MRKRITITALALLVMGWAGVAWGATYTVCSSGCDETTGDAVCDNNDLAPGDILEYRADTPGGTAQFNENLACGLNDKGDASADLIIRGREGDNITINAAAGNSILVRGYTNVSNLAFFSGNTSAIFIAGSYVTIDNNRITGGVRGVEIQNSSAKNNITISNNTLSGITNYGILYEYNDAAIRNLDDITISDNSITAETNGIRLRYSASDAGSIFQRITISGNTLAVTSNAGLIIQSGGVATINKDISIRDNTLSGGTGGIAVYGFGASSDAYGINTISGNSIDSVVGVTGGINLFYSQYVDIYENTISNITTGSVDGNGILIDHGNDNIIIKRNVINNLAGNGVVNSGIAIMILDSTNIEAYANKCLDTYMGVYYSGDGPHTNIDVHDNVFARVALHGIYIDDAMDDGDDTTTRNNIFTGTLTGGGYKCYREAAADAQTVDYNCFDDFDNNYFTQAAGANDVNTDPLFVSAGDDNFNLKSNSPCIDTGDNAVLTGASSIYSLNDILLWDGSSVVAPGETVDMGAYEYVGGGGAMSLMLTLMLN